VWQYPVVREGVMKQGYSFLILLVLILISSCGEQLENPVQVFREMKSLACAGDVEGFYSYIDKTTVEKNFKKMTLQRMRGNTINEKERKGVDPYGIREMIEVVIPNLMILKWEIMSQELKLGEAGSLCNMEVVRELEGEDAIELEFPDGKRSAWGFEKKSGEFALISILERKPFDIIDTDWGLGIIAKGPLRERGKSSVVVKNNNEERNIQKSGQEDIKNPAQDGMPILSASRKDVVRGPTNDQNVPLEENTGLDHEIVVVEEEESIQEIGVPDELIEEKGHSIAAQVSSASYDFGRAKWGMTKGQIISAEGSKPLLERGDILRFNGSYKGEDAELIYMFLGNRLVKGRYKLIERSADEMGYIRNYLRIKELLSLKYGEPRIDQEIWANASYKDMPDRRGFAVYIGHLSYKTKWSTMRTDVLLELKSGNYDMLLEAFYYSK